MNMIFDEPFYINDEPFYRNKQHLFKQSLKAKPCAGINHNTFPDTLPYDKTATFNLQFYQMECGNVFKLVYLNHSV